MPTPKAPTLRTRSRTRQSNPSLRLLFRALSGWGAPFGGARQIEFLPPLPGGYMDAVLLEANTEALEAASENPQVLREMADQPAIAWQCASDTTGELTMGELKGLIYEGHGVWCLTSGQRIRLFSDQQVVPQTAASGAEALLEALRGDGTAVAAAHSIVTMDKRGRFEAICEITSFVEPAFEAGILASRGSEAELEPYLKSPEGSAPVLCCRHTLTDQVLRFDLATLLRIKHRGRGVFELPSGKRFAVVALRAMRPELSVAAERGYVLPRIDFRPPATELH